MYKIHYFDVRARAEPLRLIFEDLGITYQDNRISIEQWPEVKANYRFGQVPVLETSEGTIEESLAIYNYVARKHGLIPDEESKRIVYDQLLSLLLTSSYELGSLFWNKDFKSFKGDMLQNKLPERLKNLERLYQENAEQPYWLADKPLNCDYHAWCYLDMVRQFEPKALTDFPGLFGFKKALERRPGIRAYLLSDRRPKRMTLSMAYFGGEEDHWRPEPIAENA